MLAEDLQVRSLPEWYKVDTSVAKQKGGSYLLQRYYNDSLADALQVVFPAHTWLPWCFAHVPRRFWKDSKNCSAYLEWVAPVLAVRGMEDWYSVSTDDIRNNYGAILHLF